MSTVVLYAWLLALSLLSRSATAAVVKTSGATTGATCTLKLQGNGEEEGITSASLACTGGTITAQLHQELDNTLGPDTALKGVKRAAEGDCGDIEWNCLLTICGSEAVFVNPSITAVSMVDLGALVCVTGGSRVTFRKGTFASCRTPPLGIYDNDTSVLVDQCSAQGNTVDLLGGAVYLHAGTLRVQSSTFKGNAASLTSQKYGGAIYAANGILTVVDTTFNSNEAYYGGAVAVEGDTRLSIRGSQFTANRAGWSGAALYAAGSAQVDILPAGQAPGASKTTFSKNTVKAYGGDLAADGDAVMRVAGAALTGGSAEGSGSVYAYGNSSITLQSCTIKGAKTTRHGGGCMSVESTASLQLIKCVVSGCQAADNGGGIWALEKARLVIKDTDITDCAAPDKNGGGIHADGNATVVLDGARLSGNSATEGGGMYLGGDATLELLGTSVFQDNTASVNGGDLKLSSSGFHPDSLSTHIRSTRTKPSNNDSTTAEHSTGGIAFATQVVEFTDPGNADNFVPSANSRQGLFFTLNISGPHGLPSDDEVALRLYRLNAGGGRTEVFTDTSRGTGEALRKVNIQPQASPGAHILQASIPRDNGIEPAELPVQVLPCQRGSVATGNNDTCITCVAGLYAFDPTSSKACSICGDFVCPGGDVVWPNPGQWHSAPHSIQMHRCFNPSACLGGAAAAAARNSTASHAKTAGRHLLSTTADSAAAADFKTSQCAGPYEGNLCGNCKPGYGRVRPFLCRKCLSTGAILVLYMLAVVVMVGLVKLLVYFTTSADLVERPDLLTPTPAELLRALVIHSQWLFIISNLVGVPWPAALTVPMQVIGGIWSSTSGSSIGFDCILRAQKGLPVAIQKVLICLFTPVFILVAVLAIEAGMHFLTPRKSARAGHDFASVVMCIVFMFLPTWVNTTLSLFTCVQLDKPVSPPYEAAAVGSFWVEHVSEQCYASTGYHRRWALGLGIPLTLLFCVALPASVFVFMWVCRKRGLLHDSQFQQHYGFLYRLWRDDWCWWESVFMWQTIFLTLVSTFGFSLGAYYQTILATAVLAMVGMLLLAVQPFKCRAANRVAVSSVVILCFTGFLSLTFLPFNGASPGPVYGNIMAVVLVIANLAFLVSTVWKLFKVVDWGAIKSLASKGCCSAGSTRRQVRRVPAAVFVPPGESKDPAAGLPKAAGH